MRFLLLGVLANIALLLPVAAQTQLTMRDLMAVPMKVQGADCALFPAEALLDTMYLHKTPIKPNRFTPTRQQVTFVENQLTIIGITTICPPISPPDSTNLAYIQTHLKNYKRQYFGFYNMHHQACFFIQFFESNLGGWLFQHVAFLDGGPSVWEVYYNLDTQRFYGLGYNPKG